jgi:hypothetical protein
MLMKYTINHKFVVFARSLSDAVNFNRNISVMLTLKHMRLNNEQTN